MSRNGIALVVLLLTVAGCGGGDEAPVQAPAPQALRLNPEQVARVQVRTVNPSFELTGITEAIQSARILPQITARVLANHFEGGEMVEAGQLLVELDPADYQVGVNAAEAGLQSAQARLKQTESNWSRAQQLKPDGFISQLDFDRAEADIQSAKAALASAESALEQAELALQRTRITAPFTGRISPPGHAIGDLVGGSSPEPLFELVQLDPIYVIAGVEESRYNRFILLRHKLEAEGRNVPALEVTIELSGGEAYPHAGTFKAWDHSADAAPGMIVARSEFPNPELILLPDQNVTLLGRAIEAVEGVFIPQRAVLQDQQGHYVMVIDENDTVVRRNIQVGIRDGADWSVRAGLEAGERLIVQGAQQLAPGTAVTVGAGT